MPLLGKNLSAVGFSIVRSLRANYKCKTPIPSIPSLHSHPQLLIHLKGSPVPSCSNQFTAFLAHLLQSNSKIDEVDRHHKQDPCIRDFMGDTTSPRSLNHRTRFLLNLLSDIRFEDLLPLCALRGLSSPVHNDICVEAVFTIDNVFSIGCVHLLPRNRIYTTHPPF